MPSQDAIVAVGAFLSGVGSVAGAFWAMKRVIRRLDDECEKRMAAFREGLDRK